MSSRAPAFVCLGLAWLAGLVAFVAALAIPRHWCPGDPTSPAEKTCLFALVTGGLLTIAATVLSVANVLRLVACGATFAGGGAIVYVTTRGTYGLNCP